MRNGVKSELADTQKTSARLRAASALSAIKIC
jgi:hypothetical protein